MLVGQTRWLSFLLCFLQTTSAEAWREKRRERAREGRNRVRKTWKCSETRVYSLQEAKVVYCSVRFNVMPTRPSGKGCAKGRWELKRLESDRNLKARVCASSSLTARRARRMGKSQHMWIEGANERAAGREVSVSQDMDSCSYRYEFLLHFTTVPARTFFRYVTSLTADNIKMSYLT